MNTSYVLESHKLIMDSYNSNLSKNFTNNVINNLDDLKTVITEKIVNFDDLASLKLSSATMAALNIANSHMNKTSISDVHEYSIQFTNAFSIALKIELYRQFFAHCQESQFRIDMDLLKVQTTRDINDYGILNFIKDRVKATIYSDFKNFEIKTGNTEEFMVFKNEMTLLQEDFAKQLSSLQKNQGTPVSNTIFKKAQDAALIFEIKAQQLIQSYQIKYEHDEQWAPFLKNLALNLLLIATGVGALVSVGLLIYRGVANRHAFFDNPILRRVPEDVRSQNQLVSENDLKEYSELLANPSENISSQTI